MSFLTGTRNYSSPLKKSLGLNDTSQATNEQASPLPYLAGKRRFSGTFITDAFDQSTQTQGSGGKNSGKGGGGQGTNYYCGFAVAFCLGPVDGLHDLFLNGDSVYTSNTPINPTGLSQLNNVATFTTQNPHGLTTGQTVLITGADQPEFNGEFVITVISLIAFTYVIPGTTLVAEIASGSIQGWLKLDPIYRGAEDSIDVTIPNYGILTLHWGTETQPADGYLQVSGTNHSPMHGVCYGVFQKFFIGLNQTNIQNIEIVLSRTPTAAWLSNQAHADIDDEANPAVVFYELLTHPRGGLGLTAGDFNLAQMAAAADQFFNDGLGISPVISRGDNALTILQQICESIDAIPLLDANGLLSMLPIRAPANYAGIQQIVDANLADIPKPKAQDWSNTFTQTRIVFPNRDAAWLNDFVEWMDFTAVQAAQKTAQPQTLQRDMITRRDVATQLCQAAAVAAAIPQITGSEDLLFTPALWAALAPGTLFQNNFANPTLARSNGIFRVQRRTLHDPAKPVFTIEYAADRSYLNQAFA